MRAAETRRGAACRHGFDGSAARRRAFVIVAPIGFECGQQGFESLSSQPVGQLLSQPVHRALRIEAHLCAGIGQFHPHVPPVDRIGDQPYHSQPHHLGDRIMYCLARYAQIAGDFGWPDDAADDIDHDHRLRPTDPRPAAIAKSLLQPFVEPTEALEQRDDKLVGAHIG